MGTRGDVYPLIYLGKALAEEGNNVVICTSPDNRDFIESLGLRFVQGGDAFTDLVEKMKPYMARPLSIIKPAKLIMESQLEMLWETIYKESIDADIIIGSGAQPIAPTVAEVIGIRYLHILHLTQVLPSRYREPILFSAYNLPRISYKILWKINDFAYNLMLKKSVNRIRRREGVIPITSYVEYINSGEMISSISPKLTQLPSDIVGQVTQTEYLFPNTDESLSPEIKEFLLAGDAPIYIGFGSMSDKKPEQTLAAILEMSERLGVRCILSRGWSNYGGKNNELLYFANSEPHGELFPYCSVVVHHGGAGTISTAALSGVPQIVIPQMLDQFYWARQVKELGIGTSIKRSCFTGKNLAKAVNTLREDPSVKERAVTLAQNLDRQQGIEQLLLIIHNGVCS